jgi:RES domain-containing protein
MIVYRITNCDYANDLSGTGARLYGGRWNNEGKSMLYTASSRSLAILEVLVHLPPLMIPDNYCSVEIEVPDDSILTINTADLPVGWQDVSTITETKEMGDAFIKNREYLMMRVPSVIVSTEYNYLINPTHPKIKEVSILYNSPFNFDERLFFKN